MKLAPSLLHLFLYAALIISVIVPRTRAIFGLRDSAKSIPPKGLWSSDPYDYGVDYSTPIHHRWVDIIIGNNLLWIAYIF